VAAPIHEHHDAKETLAYIRRTMESASTFTAVSGWGLVVVGALGVLAAGLAWSTQVPADLRVWIPAAALSIAVAAISTAFKARKLEAPLWSAALRKIAWVMAPALVSGGLLTMALVDAGARHLLPGTWLVLYGAGVTAGGVFSVTALRWMGIEFVGLGALALLLPANGLLLLALGFGGLHLAFGAYIVRRHGG
jgi:hypothetical protein